MASSIRTIHHAAVNCYLVSAGDGYVLIDTGKPEDRTDLDTDLEDAGCRPGMLRLIVLTHGDYDHAGNAAYLREKYGTKVAMHRDDSGRVERADWQWNVKPKPDKFGLIFKVVSFFIKPGPFDTFEPDLYVGDDESLSDYGIDATVLHLPGHTKGSIGILTTAGELFCGDLMDSMGKPSLEFFIDDMAAAEASLGRLRRLRVDMVYPGHGKPFRLERVAAHR